MASSETLHERSDGPATATLAAEAGIAIFNVAFERWITSTDAVPLSSLVEQAARDLANLARQRDPAVPS